MEENLIYWRDVPMDVDLGSFSYIADNWNKKIIIMSINDFPEERKKCGWEIYRHNNVETYILSEMENYDDFAFNIIKNYPNAIHIFNGIRGYKQKFLDEIIRRYPNPKIGMISESPNVSGSELIKALKEIAFFLIYHSLYVKYHKRITCFLPLGTKAVKKYSFYGWKEKSLYNYMYNPQLPYLPPLTQVENENDKVKFLYIGRFNADIKGVDILIKAIDALPEDNSWTLDMVGGYGPISDEVIKWCESKDNVTFLGSWNNDDVCSYMRQYDVCIVPSKFDGWNLTSNQAIYAGVGVIITDNSGSQEVISNSGAGLVIPANNVNALKEALQTVIDKPHLTVDWREKALQYQSRISPEIVGKYFIDIMEWCFNNESQANNERPKCPWIGG